MGHEYVKTDILEQARVLKFTFLAYPGAEHFSDAYFGQGIGSIFLDNVGCSGSETSLISCSYTTPTSSDDHSEDAAVRCPGQQHFSDAYIHYKLKLETLTQLYM